MNTIFKTLILLSACSFCLSQFTVLGAEALSSYFNGTYYNVSDYYTWWNNRLAEYNTNTYTYFNTCYADFRNVSSTTQYCTGQCAQYDTNGSCGSNCVPFVAPANFLQLTFDADQVYEEIHGWAAYGFTYAGNTILENGPYNASVYEKVLSSPTETDCYDSNGYLIAGILQEIFAIDQFWLEALYNCGTSIPSDIQAQAISQDVYDEFYFVLIGLIQSHATSSSVAAPNLGHYFNGMWAQNLSHNNVARQTLIFEELTNLLSDGVFPQAC